MESKLKVAILGVTGMIGHKVFMQLLNSSKYHVTGVVRDNAFQKQKQLMTHSENIIPNFHAERHGAISELLESHTPDVVINCIGIVKQAPEIGNAVTAIGVNSLFPHRLAQKCRELEARLIHISTDCVFSGMKGEYSEDDIPDAVDMYDRTKILGEIVNNGCLTIRTSTIGHELRKKHGLVEWFLSQEGSIQGFKNAIYTGVPTVELADIIDKYIIPNTDLAGLYHVSAAKISKFDLLSLISKTYEKDIRILEEFDTIIDRSLNSSRFREATGYTPPEWPELVNKMHSDYMANY